MIIELKDIRDKNIWDNFVTNQRNHTFLHSWAWGDLNEKMGDKVWRLGIYENSKLLAAVLLIKVRARRGNFLFVPQGPIITNGKSQMAIPLQILEKFVKEFKRIAKEEKVNFIRISPLLKRAEQNEKIFKDLGFRQAPIYMHAESTWVLDLDKSENELLMNMRKNSRNLVRRADREGVKIVSGNSQEFIDEFLTLYKKTARKHSFVPYSDEYINQEVDAFSLASTSRERSGQENNIKIYLAKFKGAVLSAALIVFYGHSAFYHHGANSDKYTKIPAAYLLQWQAIRDAKARGKLYYNFWGIAENDADKHPGLRIKLRRGKHPWAGLTFFKKGFGGNSHEYVHAQDLIISKKYWLNYLVDTYRRLRRSY